jgi:transposase-like protein
MSQHFLLSRPAKTLSLAQVFRMSDTEAEAMFRKVRWPETDGAPVCPHCGGLNAYECRRPNGLLRFRCRACREDFTITSGALFAFHKLPLRGYLEAIAIFCNEVKGKSALAISRDLGLSYKAAFVLLHKLREAMAEEMKGRKLGGEGKIAEVDGGYFGGYQKPAPSREPPRSPSRPQSKRQAQGGRGHPLNAMAARFRRCFAPKGKPFHSSVRASPKERLSMRMKEVLGMRCMPLMK